MKPTIYETITNQIVAAIEAGTEAYRMPWHVTGQDITSPRNAATGRPYRGVNVIMLWALAEARGYGAGTWATYQQWQERGARVRKGEKAASVVFWKPLEAATAENAHDSEQGGRFVARGYSVFNAAQVDGYKQPVLPVLSEAERVASAEVFFAAIPATVTHDSNQPCYIPATDTVRMVPFDRFRDAGSYYGVLAHELTHWSGAKTRLDRDLSGRFGSESYAMEELVAELGAAFIVGQLGLPGEPRRDHAPYIASWLKVLKDDSRAIFTAASRAQAAADCLAGYSKPCESTVAYISPPAPDS